MEVSISNLSCLGLHTGQLEHLPSQYGIEVFIECGNTYYWDKLIPKLMQGRSGQLSVHGPFQNIDLADCNADFEEIKAVYKWTFELCNRYGVKHCVCHPHGHGDYENIQAAREISVQRILMLNKLGRSMEVELLVENMPEHDGIFKQEEFLAHFMAHTELSFLIDIGHAYLQKWDIPHVLGILGERIKGYHLSDNFGEQDNHLMVGEGNVDWERFYKAFATYTPNATIVCEYNEGTVPQLIKSAEQIKQGIHAYYA